METRKKNHLEGIEAGIYFAAMHDLKLSEDESDGINLAKAMAHCFKLLKVDINGSFEKEITHLKAEMNYESLAALYFLSGKISDAEHNLKNAHAYNGHYNLKSNGEGLILSNSRLIAEVLKESMLSINDLRKYQGKQEIVYESKH